VHDWANAWACGEKEIGHVNIAVQRFVGYTVAILVNEIETEVWFGKRYRLPFYHQRF
jgi:hypothetical protein